MRTLWPNALLTVAVMSNGSVGHAQERPTATAVVTEHAPVIDGRLDDEAWAEVKATGGLVERKPTLRGTPPVDTQFRVLFDNEAIYVGVWCQESQLDAIAARTKNRDDGSIFRDDAISIKLDPTLDRRTTLGFVLNPASARLDYRGIDESEFRTEFDARWQGAATVGSDGWYAEFRIPYTSLGIDPSDPPPTIGLNISRDHARRNATYDWALMRPPFSPIASSLYGTLTGLDAERPGGDASSTYSLAVIPYARTGLERTQQDDDVNLTDESLLDGGLDIKGQVGRTRGHVTVNTDFAQVDLDNQEVNLSRFGLFLPEKRDFFLQDIEVFKFGRQRQAQMLYSRRIGLNDDGEVPIIVGTKVVGQPSRKMRYGLLQVTTQPEGDTPWTSAAAGRARFELGGGSNVGAMLAHRQSLDDTKDHNIMLGVDGAWRGEDVPLQLDTFAMGSLTGAHAADPQTATGGEGVLTKDRLAPGTGASLALRDELVQPRIAYAYYHPELRGDLGFFERVGVHRGDASLEIEPRIDRAGLSKMEIGGSGTAFGDADAERVLDWRATGYATLSWNAGYKLVSIVTHRFETILEPFTVGRDTEISDGEYNMWLASIGGHTPGSAAISARTFLTGRDYYGGLLLEADGSVSWAPTKLLRVDVGARYDHVTFDGAEDNPGPDFDSLVVNGRVNFGFTNTLGLRLISGYNLLGDVLQIQSRLRWIYATGSDLFLVQQVELDDDAWTPTNLSLIAKTSFTWWLL